MARRSRNDTLSYIEETPKHHRKLVRVAREGVKRSIASAKKAGHYITYAKGSRIVREYPDGRIEAIGMIDGNLTKVEKGTKAKLS